jgi:hypothetical protein
METVKNFFTNNYKTIIKVILGVIILYWLIFFLIPKNTMSSIDKDKLDSLTNIVNTLQKEQDVIEGKIDLVNQEVDKIDNNVSKIKTQKVKVVKQYHEEINRVDKYSEPELDSFFSNRYK